MSTNVSTVQSATTTPSTASSQSTTSTNSMGKDDFLKLLVAQLQNQDPMNPLQGTDFVAQLAQFSSLEQLTNINDSLTQNLQATEVMNQSIGNSLAATLVGKDVRASTNALQYSGTSSISLGYTLDSDANAVDVKVYDASGNRVKTITGLSVNSGDNSFTWDGTNDVGTQMGAGKYTFTVEAQDAAGNPITASTYMTGTVSSIRFRSDGAYFVVDGTEVPISDVLEIMGD